MRVGVRRGDVEDLERTEGHAALRCHGGEVVVILAVAGLRTRHGKRDRCVAVGGRWTCSRDVEEEERGDGNGDRGNLTRTIGGGEGSAFVSARAGDVSGLDVLMIVALALTSICRLARAVDVARSGAARQEGGCWVESKERM